MLALAVPSDPAWLQRALNSIDEILLDHAHCEKKAASTALSLVFRYPEFPELVVPLSQLAREELEHFEQVVELLRARGLEFVRQRPSPYAAKLIEVVRTSEPHRLLDTLLCCALIEARSCERMGLLADHTTDPDLKLLWTGLLASEARHYTTYVDLARATGRFEESEIRSRMAELAQHEAAVIATGCDAPRMHG